MKSEVYGSHGHLKTKKEAEHIAAQWVLLKMDISLDDRNLQRPVQGRTATELQRLMKEDKLRPFAQGGQMPAARAPTRQPSHAGITENGRPTRSSKFAKICTRKNCG